VHLRDAELLADLGLGQVAVEAEQQDALFAGRQLLPVRGHGLHVQRVLDRVVLGAEHVGEFAAVVPFR